MFVIGFLLVLIIILLFIVLFYLRKNAKKTNNKLVFNKNELDLILFLIHMYLEYGESLDIYPTDESKEILITKIKELKILTEKNKSAE